MVNSQVVKETADAFKIDQRVEPIPTPIPVVEVGVKSVKVGVTSGSTRGSSGTLTLYTTPADVDFYLTGLNFNYMCTVLCDATSGEVAIIATIGGVATTIARISTITLTVIDKSIDISFEHPLKIDRDRAIYTTTAFTAGSLQRSGNIRGFLDEIS